MTHFACRRRQADFIELLETAAWLQANGGIGRKRKSQEFDEDADHVDTDLSMPGSSSDEIENEHGLGAYDGLEPEA